MSRPEALRVVFLGTPDFALPSLRSLARSRHPLVGVISQPDRPRGRGRKLEPTPSRAEADRLGLPLLQPEGVGEPRVIEWLADLAPDLGCVVAFGQFLPRGVRELPRLGMINAHASLLPRHRGAAPIQHAVLAGDRRTGVSVIRVVREMDAGDCCLMREIEIGPGETAGELSERLADLAAEALLEAVEQMAAGRAEFQPQDPSGVTLAPKLGREFGRIDWGQPCDDVLRRIRAASPWPGADLRLRPSGTRLRILEAGNGLPGERPERPERPGQVRVEAGRLWVSALDGWVRLLRIQKPGGRPMSAAEYLRGTSVSAAEEVEGP